MTTLSARARLLEDVLAERTEKALLDYFEVQDEEVLEAFMEWYETKRKEAFGPSGGVFLEGFTVLYGFSRNKCIPISGTYILKCYETHTTKESHVAACKLKLLPR